MNPQNPSATIAAPRNGGSLRIPTAAYSWFVVLVLTGTYTVAFIDRQMLNLLVDPIKQALGVSDTRFSLLQGLAFMCALLAFSPICGRLADRVNRRNLLLGAVLVWSLCTAACGLSHDYWVLFSARIGVGAAEAAVTPVGWSMIANYFARDRLPVAMSVFLIGPYLGGGLALILGGVLIGAAPAIAQALPLLRGLDDWQIVFIVAAGLGLPLLLLLTLVREPSRQAFASGEGDQANLTLSECMAFLWQRRAFFAPFFLGMSSTVISLYSLPAWMPAVMTRSLGADPAQVGVQYGTLVLVAGTAGVLFGPLLGRLLKARGRGRTNVLVPLIAAAGLIPASLAVGLVGSYGQALVVATAATFLFSMPQAMAASVIQETTPSGMRGLSAALYASFVTMIGLTLAPTLVAFLTDTVLRDPARVGTSLSIVCTVSAAIGTWLLIVAMRHYRPLDADAEAASPSGHI